MSASFLASLNQGVGLELLSAYAVLPTPQVRNALAMHYALCAQVVARQVYRGLTKESKRQTDLADVEQTAMALLFQLVEKYDLKTGVPLSAFLTTRLRFGLIDQLRTEGLMVRTGRTAAAKRVVIAAHKLPSPTPSPLQHLVDHETEILLKRAYGSPKPRMQRSITQPVLSQKQHSCSTTAPLPIDLHREKDFRRWMLRRVPWAYRKLVAWRYLRGRDLDWTATRLGLNPAKAQMMDRAARPLMQRAIEEYRCGVTQSV